MNASAMSKIKCDCFWWNHRPKGSPGCGVLTEVVCAKGKKCSFYETEEEFRLRNPKFDLEKKGGM